MIVKTVTYENFNEETVTEDLYFAISELEAAEMQLEYGTIAETMRQLNTVEDIQQAYKLFKSIVLGAYGHKSIDGKRFNKKDDNERPYRLDLESSNALGAVIIPMLQDAKLGAEFFQKVLPTKFHEQMGAALAAENAAGVVNKDADQPKPEPTDEELLQMDFGKMTPAQQKRAWDLKSKS